MSAGPRTPSQHREGISAMHGVIAVLVMLGAYYVIQWLTGVLAVHPHVDLAPSVRSGGWVQAFDHHFWQLAFALLLIAVLARGRWREWGLNLRNRDESLRIVRRFVFVYGVYFIGIGFIVQLLFVPAPDPGHPVTAINVAGRLAFGFLFVGVSEEVLFRGLMHTYLARYWRGVWEWRGWEMPVAGVIAALIFTIAHIGFTLRPAAITHLDGPQLAMAFVLGVFYSAAYHRTGSLLAPILAHNFSDGALWVSEYALFWVKG